MVTDVTRDKKTVSQSMFIISDEVVYHTSTNATLTSYTPKSLNNVIREVLLAQFQLKITFYIKLQASFNGPTCIFPNILAFTQGMVRTQTHFFPQRLGNKNVYTYIV